MILVSTKYIFCEEMSSVLTPWSPIYYVCPQLNASFFTYFTQKKT